MMGNVFSKLSCYAGRAILIWTFSLISGSITAQDCEDIDIGRYPLLFHNTEISPGVFGDQTFPWNDDWNFTNLKQTRVSFLDIGGTDLFHGLFQYLPPSYTLPANASKEYPVIIYFHGGGSQGDGSSAQLCRLFKDLAYDLNTHLSIPGRVERNTGLFTQTFGGETYEYIVISPQFSDYKRLQIPPAVDKFPTADHVEDVIDYVESHYRIDPRRIYLTGFSNGANMITEYAASSLARAKRVAGIMPVALCSDLTHSDNVSRGYDASYIGQAKLSTWFVYCAGDNCGGGSPGNISQAWVDKIKSIPGHTPPRYTVLKNQNPPSLYNCSDTLLHDAWSRAYDPNFTASFVNGTGVNDGINKNMYEWFSEQLSAVLPVKLKSYTARLINNKVELNWITTDEKDNASFTIERAGADQKFSAIGTIPGAGNNKGEKTYTFTDDNPLADLSFYRLVQTDIDGEKTYFDIKRIINQKDKKSLVIISPNPVATSISAFISIEKTQKVFLSLTDMTGKIIRSVNGIYGQGSSEVRINVNDLPKGIYLLKVSGENFKIVQKVVKK